MLRSRVALHYPADEIRIAYLAASAINVLNMHVCHIPVTQLLILSRGVIRYSIELDRHSQNIDDVPSISVSPSTVSLLAIFS